MRLNTGGAHRLFKRAPRHPQQRIQQEFVDWIFARDVRDTADGVCQSSFMKKGRESLHANILSIDLWHRLGGSRRWGLVKGEKKKKAGSV